jgi:transcriptional regulator with XRE-family HTH domain
VVNQESFDVAFKLQEEMTRAGLERAKVLSEAGVSRATFWRWLQNVSSPRKASITAIKDAIQRLRVESQEKDV